MNYRCFVLGLLARQPMSGYDIKRCFESFGWLIHSPSFGSLYPALHALQEDGCLTMQVAEGESGLSRKVYTITESGRQALEKWGHESAEADTSLKTFLMHLMVADTLSCEALLTHLEQRRSQLSDYQTALKQAGDATGDNGDLGEQLALDYGRVMAAAETVWLERKLAQLCPPPRESAAEKSGSM
jgi:PadR family transcriptional regulator, regulatory protein AphA